MFRVQANLKRFLLGIFLSGCYLYVWGFQAFLFKFRKVPKYTYNATITRIALFVEQANACIHRVENLKALHRLHRSKPFEYDTCVLRVTEV